MGHEKLYLPPMEDSGRHTFTRKTADGREIVTIHPEIHPGEGITDRYVVILSGPVSFTIQEDENGIWRCDHLPPGIDPDLVQWAGNEIER